MPRNIFSVLVPLLMLFTQPVLAQQASQDSSDDQRAAIEIISIEHRDPVLVRSQLLPSLDPRGSIGVVDNKLIVASTVSNMQQLQSLIAEADMPLRRLVVSVDFEYGRPRPDNSAQQSIQTVEGQQISVTDLNSPELSLSLSSQLRGSSAAGYSADVNLEMFNVPGFTGRHRLDLPLQQWYVINPELDQELDPELDSELDQENSMPPPIAIRVDVLP